MPLPGQTGLERGAVSTHDDVSSATHDPTNNFKLYSRRFLESVTIESTAGFELALELTVKASLAGLRIAEVPRPGATARPARATSSCASGCRTTSTGIGLRSLGDGSAVVERAARSSRFSQARRRIAKMERRLSSMLTSCSTSQCSSNASRNAARSYR